MKLTKVIIPTAGIGTRFLPLTKIIPKELLPVANKPMIAYTIDEVQKSGFKNIVFVLRAGRQNVIEYLTPDFDLEKLLIRTNKEKLLQSVRDIYKSINGMNIFETYQKDPLGDGDALLSAKDKIKDEAFAVAFPDDIIESKKPALTQLKEIFDKYEKPILGLKKVGYDNACAYGSVAVKQIDKRLYKIKKLIEKPKREEVLSEFVSCSRFIYTPILFDYLEKTPKTVHGETITADAVRLMLEDGETIFGYNIEGDWHECGDMKKWMRTNKHFISKYENN